MFNRNHSKPNVFPGKKLEHFVKWDLNIVIDTLHQNPHLFNLEVNACLIPPTILEQWQFDIILELFEPYREKVEDCLDKYDNAKDEWLSYSQFGMVYIPTQVYLTCERLWLNNFLK